MYNVLHGLDCQKRRAWKIACLVEVVSAYLHQQHAQHAFRLYCWACECPAGSKQQTGEVHTEKGHSGERHAHLVMQTRELLASLNWHKVTTSAKELSNLCGIWVLARSPLARGTTTLLTASLNSP